MKKIVSLMLVVLLMCGPFASLAEELTADEGMTRVESYPAVEDTIGVQEGTELVVGTSTAIGGYFATDMWGNNTADMDVRALLHGYSTVATTRTRGLALDGTAVASVTTQTDEDGRTYVVNIREGLTYNDGTPITAKDYVFSLLLSGAPEVAEIGGTPRGLSHLTGFAAYQRGDTEVLSGVHLLSDYSFSLSISNDYLPYFFGLAMLNVTPMPMSVIAPGCDIIDDGEGAFIGAGADAQAMDATALGFTPGVFNAQMLEKTLLDSQTGYVFNPRVTSGPYQLESFDSEKNEAVFSVNPNYIGNYEGQRPHIERLVFAYFSGEEMVARMERGEVGLLNKVTDSSVIELGTTLSGAQDAPFRSVNYPRTGFAFLAFACEEGPTQSVAVRQAIAHSVDKLDLVSKAAGRYGLVVNGYYGMGQWMINQTFPAQDGMPEINVAEQLDQWAVPYDLAAAEELLVSDGWVLNADGGDFAKGTDQVRYRMVDGVLEPLSIRWAKSEDSTVADVIEQLLRPALESLGMELLTDEIPFNDMLAHYYRQEDRTYNMFYLASNFSYLFDPYYDYNVDDAYQGLVNTSGLRDETLMDLARDMRETPTTDMRGYVTKWLAFQERWVELMPMVPLYSNTYFDFYQSDLQTYDISQHPGWAYAIQYAWIGEPEEVDLPEEIQIPEGEEGSETDLISLDDLT